MAGAPAAGAAGAAADPLAGAASAGAGMMPAADPNACDRACLLAVMQQYIDALMANDPSMIKTSDMLRYSENGVEAKLGDTVWMTAESLVEGTRLDFADPTLQNVTSQFAFNESGGREVIYQVRLKVVAHVDELDDGPRPLGARPTRSLPRGSFLARP